jgi:hypothetical protein
MSAIVVQPADVSSAFDALVNGTQSREEIERWADERMRAEDEGRLQYEPKHEEARIWRGISYLGGVALQQVPGAYLHCVDDFVAFRRQHGF